MEKQSRFFIIKDSIAQYITRWCHLKTRPVPIITSRTGPIITMRSVHENKAIHIHSLENLSCPCNHHLKFSQKYPRFNEVIWKFELPLLSCSKRFPKIKQFCWYDLENCPPLIIMNWNFWKKLGSFDDVTWKF